MLGKREVLVEFGCHRRWEFVSVCFVENAHQTAEKLLKQILFSNRLWRALSRLPTCASLRQRKSGMQPGKPHFLLVRLLYSFKMA